MISGLIKNKILHLTLELINNLYTKLRLLKVFSLAIFLISSFQDGSLRRCRLRAGGAAARLLGSRARWSRFLARASSVLRGSSSEGYQQWYSCSSSAAADLHRSSSGQRRSREQLFILLVCGCGHGGCFLDVVLTLWAAILMLCLFFTLIPS